jgi:hypothetical protein
MKKILSERNLVVVLFIAALTIFFLCPGGCKKRLKNSITIPRLYLPFLLRRKQTASNSIPVDGPVISMSPAK